MRVLDYYREFERRDVSCRHCGWTGKGVDTKLGDASGHGIERHCPACGERCGFAQFPVIVSDDPPADWKAKISPVEF